MRSPGELSDEEADLIGEYQSPERREEAEAAERERTIEAELRRQFLVSLMGNPMFREWLMETLNGWMTFENPFGASPNGFPDPLATQFALGQKAAGWHLWTQFDDLVPALTSQMRREYGKPPAARVPLVQPANREG